MLRATHGHLASKNENKRQKIFGQWFEVMTAGTADKVALYWYVEPSVLTHMSWCGDYTHTHACTRTASTQHSHKHMQPRTHATLTRTHARMHAHTSTPHDQHTLSRSSAQPTCACAHIRPWQTHTQPADSAHGLEPCRACVNLCLSNLFPMRTDRWDPLGTWSI